MSIAIATSQVLKICLNKGSRVEINHSLENFSWWGQAFVSESSWSIRQCSDLGRMDCLLLEVWLSTSFTKYRLADIRSYVTLFCICSYSCELWQCVCVCACVRRRTAWGSGLIRMDNCLCDSHKNPFLCWTIWWMKELRTFTWKWEELSIWNS